MCTRCAAIFRDGVRNLKQGVQEAFSETAEPDESGEAGPPESRRKERRVDRRKPGKKGRRRSRTIATKRLSKEELALAEELRTVEYERPKTRSECVSGMRPCPYVSCKHHLYLDVNPETGSIKLNFPDLDVWEMQETCALDVADRGGITLERIRQVEVKGLEKLRDTAARLGLRDFLAFIENNISID